MMYPTSDTWDPLIASPHVEPAQFHLSGPDSTRLDSNQVGNKNSQNPTPRRQSIHHQIPQISLHRHGCASAPATVRSIRCPCAGVRSLPFLRGLLRLLPPAAVRRLRLLAPVLRLLRLLPAAASAGRRSRAPPLHGGGAADRWNGDRRLLPFVGVCGALGWGPGERWCSSGLFLALFL